MPAAAPSQNTAKPYLAAFHGVGKTYANGVAALEGLDFTIREGEFLSLLGPSGCGKSSALRLLAGLAAPTSGSIDWHNHAAATEAGFVFQEPTLMPWATVLGNVRLPLQLKGSAAKGQIDEALSLVGLTDFRDAYPRELSGGMRMRVSIARALVTKPRLLLMDEPFAALDEISRFKLNDDLRRLWKQIGCTVVFVTHSVFESVYLSNRILMFTPRPGKIAAEFEVQTAEPREGYFRTSPEYGQKCREVSATLAKVMGEA